MKVLIGLLFLDLVWLAVPAFSQTAQSLIVLNNSTSAMTDPNRLQTDSWRVEFQMHSWSTPGSTQNAITLNGTGMEVDIDAAGRLALVDKRDTSLTTCLYPLAGYTDVLVRIQRDYGSLAFKCEIWNVDGTGYNSTTNTFTPNAWPYTGGQLGDTAVSFRLGFLRILNTLVPMNGTPPTTATTDTLFSAWPFDGNLTDASGNGHSITFAGAAYAASTDLGPYPIIRTLGAPWWTNAVSLRAGKSNTLDGSYSYSMALAGSAVTYFWTALDAPSVTLWSSRTVAQPVVNGLVFGDYLISLTATDASGARQTATLHMGAVATDDNYVVIPKQERLMLAMTGPQILYGRNPWPYADHSNSATADVVGGEMGGPTSGLLIAADWKVPETGTVAISGSTVTGTGTALKTRFCGGGSSPSGGFYFVMTYDDPATMGRAGTWYSGVAGCASETSITLTDAFPYSGSTCLSACAHARSTNVGGCVSGIGSYGYYNSATQFFQLWQRSGIGRFRDYGRALNKITATCPGIDEGVLYMVAARINPTLQYAMQLAVDPGQPEDASYTRTLRNIAAKYSDTFVNGYVYANQSPFGAHTITDVRERTASYGDIAAAALVETDATQLANQKTWLEAGYTNQFAPQVKSDGHWVSWYAGNGVAPTVNLTNGSAIVTPVSGTFPADYCGTISTRAGSLQVVHNSPTIVGTGTDFTGTVGKMLVVYGHYGVNAGKDKFLIASVVDATHLITSTPMTLESESGLTFVIMSAPAGSAGIYGHFMLTDSSGTLTTQYEQPYWYGCTRDSTTQVTLDRAFVSPTGGNLYGLYSMDADYVNNSAAQPFYEGFAHSALQTAAAVGTTHSVQIKALADGLYPYISGDAYLASANGIHYAEGFADCLPKVTIMRHGCDGSGDVQALRMYGVELVQALAQAYLSNPTGPKKTFGDTLYGGEWGWDEKYGASPYSDGQYVVDCGAGTFAPNVNLKYPAQCHGLGSSASWPAARLGGAAAANPRTLSIGFRLANITNAAKVRCTLTLPSGATVQATATSSPCAVAADVRQGDHLLKLEYLTSGDVVLATSDQQVVKVN